MNMLLFEKITKKNKLELISILVVLGIVLLVFIVDIPSFMDKISRDFFSQGLRENIISIAKVAIPLKDRILIRTVADKLARIHSANSCQFCDLNQVNMKGLVLKGIDLRYANLAGADLAGANLTGANLRGANLSGVDLSGTILIQANLSRTNLSGVDLSGVDLRGKDLSRTILSGVDLKDKDLSGANLRGANLSGVDLSGTTLRGDDLSDKDLDGNVMGNNTYNAEFRMVPSRPLVFSVIGDIPYSVAQAELFSEHIQAHNDVSNALFMVHLGDIMFVKDCSESFYLKAANILHELTIQTFVIVGDNEWNDCADPDEAWMFWTTHISRFDEYQSSNRNVLRQSERDENFAWTEEAVLFIGLNLVGGRTHDSKEWETRLNHDADWVEDHFSSAQDSVYAAIVFGHARPTTPQQETFFTRFREAVKEFGRPVLYIHGDGHTWIHDHPWPENITRVEVEAGAPVQVTVSSELGPVFAFNRTPFD